VKYYQILEISKDALAEMIFKVTQGYRASAMALFDRPFMTSYSSLSIAYNDYFYNYFLFKDDSVRISLWYLT